MKIKGKSVEQLRKSYLDKVRSYPVKAGQIKHKICMLRYGKAKDRKDTYDSIKDWDIEY